MDEPVQLDLFGWKPPKAKAKTEAQPKNGTDFELEELQGFVGGLIEVLHSRYDHTIMVVNEEGKNLGLDENPYATTKAFISGMITWWDNICGDVLICNSEQVK